jgi:ribonuclease HII
LKARPETPSFVEERRLRAQGYRYIAGIDEVGRGALAGPVVAAAVILPSRIKAPWAGLVRDSKQLTPQKRELLYPHIHKIAMAIGIGSVDCQAVDTLGIVRATEMAMKQAIDRLSPSAEVLLIDFMSLPEVKLPQKGIIEGDSRCFSIACASIVAKVTRDRLMTELDRVYPGYLLAQHKGYGTAAHLACLHRLGPSPIHRRTFQPIRNIIEEKIELKEGQKEAPLLLNNLLSPSPLLRGRGIKRDGVTHP